MNQTALPLETLYPEDLLTGGHQACPGCGGTIALRQALMALGPRTVIVIPASCMATVGGSGLSTAWRIPFVHSLFECAPAVASGIKAALVAQGKNDVQVVTWAGDAGSADIGFQSLSGAAERNEDILHVCYDNEVYMNTGGQAGSLTPSGATTQDTARGKPTRKKDLFEIMCAHHIPYAATASIAYPQDLIAKVQKAKTIKGFRFIHVLTPCPEPTGWDYPADQTIAMARLAVETGLWQLAEMENGERRITYAPEQRRPVEEYLLAQGRFRRNRAEIIRSLETEIP